MRQAPIDLMPDSVRARSQAGAVVRRYVMVLLIGVAVLIAPATHSRLLLRTAKAAVVKAEADAAHAIDNSDRAEKIRKKLEQSRAFIGRYAQVAMPFEVSRLIATIVNDLPPSATLDSITLHVENVRRHSRPGVSADDEVASRVLHGELVGFVDSDGEAHDLAARINGLGLCDNAKVEYTKQLDVDRARMARGFRISFKIDLNRPVEIVDRDDSAGEWMGHVE